MMTMEEFHNGLRVLRSIDAHEIGNPEWWAQFREDPYHFFIRCNDEAADTIWAALEARI